jgi:hypothetical protein
MAVYVRLEVDMGVVKVCGLIVYPGVQQKVQIMMKIAGFDSAVRYQQ